MTLPRPISNPLESSLRPPQIAITSQSSPKVRPTFDPSVKLYESETIEKTSLQTGRISPTNIRRATSPRPIIKKGRLSIESNSPPDLSGSSPPKSVTFPPKKEKSKSPQPTPPTVKRDSHEKESSKSKRKWSDPEKWKFRTAEGRSNSVLDLLTQHRKHDRPSYDKTTNPYQDLSLTYFETPDSEEFLALQEPFRMMIRLNRFSERNAKAFLGYRKVIIEKNDEREIIRTSDLVDNIIASSLRKGKRDESEPPKRPMTNEELLTRIFKEVYKAGYVNKRVSDEKVKQEVDLLFLTGPLYSTKEKLDPRIQFIFYNAHIPAYRLLCAMSPFASYDKTYSALRHAFPVIFPSGRHKNIVKKTTKYDGETRYYLTMEKKGVGEEDEDFQRIRVIEPGKAEVIHKRCFKIYATIVIRLEDPVWVDGEATNKKYTISEMKVPVGEMDIEFIIREQKNKGEGDDAFPFYSIDIQPTQVKRYDKTVLEENLRKNDRIKTAFDSARKDLKESLQVQLKPQTYQLDDDNMLKCEEK